jgi:hypothetical protein
MIGITVSGEAYAAIAGTLPAGSARLWLPQTVVNRLRSLRAPGETFSAVILRLVERGPYAVITR